MPDLLFVVITVAFFVVAAGFVTVCDRIIGPDLHADGRPDPEAETGADAADPATDLVTAVDPR